MLIWQLGFARNRVKYVQFLANSRTEMAIKKTEQNPQDDMFRNRLENMIDMRHPLVKLADAIDWEVFDREFGQLYQSKVGRPATRTRLIVGLTYLQFMYDLSDEAVVERWIEVPYWQYFTGEEFFQHRMPIDPTTLGKWRKKIGEEGCEWLLTQTLEAAKDLKMLKKSSLQKVVVDTTVMEKNIAFPTDSQLLNRVREHLVREADRLGIALRQNYNREAPELVKKAGRYAHAKQMRRVKSTVKKLKTIVGRVVRDIERKVVAGGLELSQKTLELLALAKRLRAQQRRDSNKVYSVHAPEVSCIAKGKARQPYEFGCKVSVAVTAKDTWVVGCRSFAGNPYDGHTLESAAEQVEILTGVKPKQVFVDRGYKAAYLGQNTEVVITGQRRHTAATKRWMRRRNCVEPIIGHLKSEHRMKRCGWSGELGNAMFAVLAGAGFNLKKLLRALALFAPLIFALLNALKMEIQKLAVKIDGAQQHRHALLAI
jgi:IS5 family transposase